MAFEYMGAPALDYELCKYANSRSFFRGPKVDTDADYIAVAGGTETFGMFVEHPYSDLLQKLLEMPVANLGQRNCGAGFLSSENSIMGMCNRATVTILQIPCVQNMSNDFYSVHPRRNDRFLCPTALLRTIYPDMDYTDIHFTGHLMQALNRKCPIRFEKVLNKMREFWVAQMQFLTANMTGTVILLWMSDHAPGAPNRDWCDPMFVTRAMLDKISNISTRLVEVVAMPEEISAGFERMVFNPLEEPAAELMLGPIVHQEVARQLYTALAG